MGEVQRTTLITLKATRKAVDVALDVGNPPVEVSPPIETAARAFPKVGTLVPSWAPRLPRKYTFAETLWAIAFVLVAIAFAVVSLTGP